jgi:hypothetical protein
VAGPGDGGMLDDELEGASPLMISWIDASRASTRCDICTTIHMIFELQGIAGCGTKELTATDDLR